MPKLKKMPKTQGVDKYIGPFTTSRITDNHAVIPKEELGSQKTKKSLFTLHALTISAVVIPANRYPKSKITPVPTVFLWRLYLMMVD